MPADRDLRLQQVGAAQTRGELNALTRGLDPSAPATTYRPPHQQTSTDVPRPPQAPAHTPLPPPQQASAYAQPPSAHAPPAAGYQPGRPVAPKKSIVRPVAIGVIIVLVTCGGGLVSCVSAVVKSVQDISSDSSPSSPRDLETEEGWTDMVDAFSDEVGLGDTVGVLVRRRSATLSVYSDEVTAARFYYDGDVTPTSEVSREPSEVPFDLSAIDPTVAIDAVDRARRASGESKTTEAWVHITGTDSGPHLVVGFPSGTATTYGLVVDADGAVISETF